MIENFVEEHLKAMLLTDSVFSVDNVDVTVDVTVDNVERTSSVPSPVTLMFKSVVEIVEIGVFSFSIKVSFGSEKSAIVLN